MIHHRKFLREKRKLWLRDIIKRNGTINKGKLGKVGKFLFPSQVSSKQENGCSRIESLSSSDSQPKKTGIMVGPKQSQTLHPFLSPPPLTGSAEHVWKIGAVRDQSTDKLITRFPDRTPRFTLKLRFNSPMPGRHSAATLRNTQKNTLVLLKNCKEQECRICRKMLQQKVRCQTTTEQLDAVRSNYN